MASGRFLHLASCDEAAGVVEETLSRLGRDEEVIAMRDDSLTEGPLHDLDSGGASRRAWWNLVHDASEMGATARW